MPARFGPSPVRVCFQERKPTAVPHLIHNEQTKLFAGMLDRVGTVCLAVGVATPASAFVIGSPQVPIPNLSWLIGSGAVWTAMFIALHQAAQSGLEDLRE